MPLRVSGAVVLSYGPWQYFQVSSVTPFGGGGCMIVSGPLRVLHGSQWPVSYWVLMLVCSAAQGVMLPRWAVLYSGWKLNGWPEQSAIDVFAKPFLAEACMNPV